MKEKQRANLIPILLALVVMLCWGSLYPTVKLGYEKFDVGIRLYRHHYRVCPEIGYPVVPRNNDKRRHTTHHNSVGKHLEYSPKSLLHGAFES